MSSVQWCIAMVESREQTWAEVGVRGGEVEILKNGRSYLLVFPVLFGILQGQLEPGDVDSSLKHPFLCSRQTTSFSLFSEVAGRFSRRIPHDCAPVLQVHPLATRYIPFCRRSLLFCQHGSSSLHPTTRKAAPRLRSVDVTGSGKCSEHSAGRESQIGQGFCGFNKFFGRDTFWSYSRLDHLLKSSMQLSRGHTLYYYYTCKTFVAHVTFRRCYSFVNHYFLQL